jgi:hypothetical protein
MFCFVCRLLIAQSFYNLVKESAATYQTSCNIVDKLNKSWNERICATSLSKIYNAFSIYHYSENRYEQASYFYYYYKIYGILNFIFIWQ